MLSYRAASCLSISFRGTFQGKLGGKHDKVLPSKRSRTVQTVASFRGRWLALLLRLQIWLCPAGLSSQQHGTAALQKAPAGELETGKQVNTAQLRPKQNWAW